MQMYVIKSYMNAAKTALMLNAAVRVRMNRPTTCL